MYVHVYVLGYWCCIITNSANAESFSNYKSQTFWKYWRALHLISLFILLEPHIAQIHVVNSWSRKFHNHITILNTIKTLQQALPCCLMLYHSIIGATSYQTLKQSCVKLNWKNVTKCRFRQNSQLKPLKVVWNYQEINAKVICSYWKYLQAASYEPRIFHFFAYENSYFVYEN